MKRRAFLGATAGSLAAGLAGCLGGGSGGNTTATTNPAPLYHPGNLDVSFTANGNYPDDETPANGLPPQTGETPAERSVDTSAFETIDVNGETVRLAPLSVVEYWYRRANTRFVDARAPSQYKRSHVYGAVDSPARPNSVGGGIDGWPTDARIVAYCGCPHHLSSIRAAGLQKAGYSNVFVIDEGFWAWHDQGYPMAGTDFTTTTAARIDGRVDAAYTGEYAWATAPATGQQEAAPIDDDGRYSLHLRFSGLTDSTRIRVDTPAYSVTAPLAELTAGVVTG